jgi:hypothetical protein
MVCSPRTWQIGCIELATRNHSNSGSRLIQCLLGHRIELDDMLLGGFNRHRNVSPRLAFCDDYLRILKKNDLYMNQFQNGAHKTTGREVKVLNK